MRWLETESQSYLRMDVLRFVAASGIVALHAGDWWEGANGVSAQLSSTSSLHLFVDLFFVVSGVMIHQLYQSRIASLRDYGRFLRKRFARLVPLHYATLLMVAALFVAQRIVGGSVSHPEAQDLACLPWQLTLTHAFGTCSSLTFNGPSWSISAEMAMYAAFPGFLLLQRKGLLAPLVALALVILAWTSNGDASWTDRTFNLGVLRAIPSFALGCLLSAARPRLARLPGAEGALWVSLAATVVALTSGANALWCLALVYACVTFAVAADARSQGGPFARAVAPLATLTYSLYMLHVPVFSAVLGAGKLIFGWQGASMNIAVLATAFVLIPLMALASLHGFESPARRWISGLGSGRDRAGAAKPSSGLMPSRANTASASNGPPTPTAVHTAR